MAISNLDVDVLLGTQMISFNKVTLSIEDSSKAATSRGRPNGTLRGSVSAEGEVVMNTNTLNTLLDEAKKSGSFQELAPFDLTLFAEAGDTRLKVEVFGAKFTISDLLDADNESEDEVLHTLPYFVTGKEFVRINGVPYARSKDIEKLQ